MMGWLISIAIIWMIFVTVQLYLLRWEWWRTNNYLHALVRREIAREMDDGG